MVSLAKCAGSNQEPRTRMSTSSWWLQSTIGSSCVFCSGTDQDGESEIEVDGDTRTLTDLTGLSTLFSCSYHALNIAEQRRLRRKSRASCSQLIPRTTRNGETQPNSDLTPMDRRRRLFPMPWASPSRKSHTPNLPCDTLDPGSRS